MALMRQGLLGLLALSDVAPHADEPHRVAQSVPQGHFRCQQPSGVTGRVLGRFFAVDHGQARPHHLPFVFGVSRRHVPRVIVGIGPAQELLRPRRAHAAGKRGIGDQEPALGVLHINIIRDVVNERAQQIALVGKRLLGPRVLLKKLLEPCGLFERRALVDIEQLLQSRKLMLDPLQFLVGAFFHLCHSVCAQPTNQIYPVIEHSGGLPCHQTTRRRQAASMSDR